MMASSSSFSSSSASSSFCLGSLENICMDTNQSPQVIRIRSWRSHLFPYFTLTFSPKVRVYIYLIIRGALPRDLWRLISFSSLSSSPLLWTESFEGEKNSKKIPDLSFLEAANYFNYPNFVLLFLFPHFRFPLIACNMAELRSCY